MKKEINSAQPFEQLMRAYVVCGNVDTPLPSNIDKEAEFVFSGKYDTVLPKEKVQALLGLLTIALSKDSLGALVTRSLLDTGVDEVMLKSATGLSSSLLEDIKSDMIFTNSIPVKSLVKLFKFLKISVANAKDAIQVTFEKLREENRMLIAINTSARPVYRRGNNKRESSLDFKKLKTDESYLYQNKEALDIYTKRMEELFNEQQG